MDKSLEEGVKVSQDLAEEFLDKLDVKAKVKTSVEDSAIKVEVDGDDLGLLIGYHGESLEALQLLLVLMVNNKIESQDWLPVSLDVGGWRKDRTTALNALVEKAAAGLKSSGDAVELPSMPASQRRTVHLILANYPDLTSESIGEDPERKVVIKKA